MREGGGLWASVLGAVTVRTPSRDKLDLISAVLTACGKFYYLFILHCLIYFSLFISSHCLISAGLTACGKLIAIINNTRTLKKEGNSNSIGIVLLYLLRCGFKRNWPLTQKINVNVDTKNKLNVIYLVISSQINLSNKSFPTNVNS